MSASQVPIFSAVGGTKKRNGRIFGGLFEQHMRMAVEDEHVATGVLRYDLLVL